MIVAALCAPALAEHPAQSAVTDLLHQQAGELSAPAVVTVDTASLARLASCESVEAFLNGSPVLRNRMSVGLRCREPEEWTAYVQASVSVPGEYPVVNRDIAAGSTISSEDLDLVQGDLLALPRNVIVEARQAEGAIVTRRIRAGQPLRHNALRDAQSIRRGQTVRLIINGAGFVATSEGQAMTSAAPGAIVQVRTANGHRTSGVVRDANTVEIMM